MLISFHFTEFFRFINIELHINVVFDHCVVSEVVIPLFKDGKNIGQIDIDSNTIDPFSEDDELFLEWVNAEVARVLKWSVGSSSGQ